MLIYSKICDFINEPSACCHDPYSYEVALDVSEEEHCLLILVLDSRIICIDTAV